MLPRRKLTSNTTETDVQALRRAGRIVLFEPPRLVHEGYRRRLWMHPDVANWVESKGATAAKERYHADVRAFLKKFIIGEDFDDDALLKPLKPHDEGIWEFKITFHPEDRIFGGFLRRGEFIATNRKDRAALVEGFAQHRARCKGIWNSLCSKYPRLTERTRKELLEEFDDGSV
jgi:hypothetical protein